MIFLFLYAAPYWGSLYFNGCGYSIFGALAFVSVPYWGSLYFNCKIAYILTTSALVSVPYWGSLYFNKYSFSYTRLTCYRFPSPIVVLYISILSSAALIITGLQSRIAVQNQIRLLPSEKLISSTAECQCFRASAQKS